MWFVSQIQNALSTMEPSDESFMGLVREMKERNHSSSDQNVSDVLSNPHLKTTKILSASDEVNRLSRDESSLYSNECVEFQSYYCLPKSKKNLDHTLVTFTPTPKNILETRECTLLEESLHEKVKMLSTNDVGLVNSTKVCTKMSCTTINRLKQGDGDGVAMNETRQKLSQPFIAVEPTHLETACNECENTDRIDADESCMKCDSIPIFHPVGSNKTDSYPKQEKGSTSKILKSITVTKLNDSGSKMEKPKKVIRAKKLEIEDNKSDAVCLYNRDKKVAYRTKKINSEPEVIPPKVQPSTLPFQRRNELPIHLRPLSPVHDKNRFSPPQNRRREPISCATTSDESRTRPDVGICQKVNVFDCKDTSRTQPDVGICQKVNVFDCKDTSTSTDVDDFIAPIVARHSPISTVRSRPTSSRATKIPIPFQSYCYSKISTVEQKIFIAGDSRKADQSEDTLIRLESHMLGNDGMKSIQAPPIVNENCEKRIVRPSSPRTSKKSISVRKPKPESADVVSRFIQPSDLVKRIEMIRRKLAEAESGNGDDDREALCTTKSVYFKIVTQDSQLGESGSGIKARGAVQDFYDLRDYHCNNGTLFEDPEFPANSSSLTHNGRTDRHYEWLRPGEIVDDPQLFVEGYSRFDVQQGELGDCWLLAAVANLTLYRRLFFQIVPDDQGFDEKYAGIFHFRFWQYGRWIDVVIDDRLPTYRGQLIYLHSNEENEFWSALLEKAYAKLHGSYEALKGGSTCEAMEDFTGGVTEMYEMKSSPPNLFKIILKAYERGSLMGSSLEPDPNVLEAETREGLIRGHAYSITRVKYVDIRTPNTVGKIPLLRLRNPWGNEIEWNGPWSDQSPEWRFIPDHEKENLGLTFDHDGEFWMSFKDFQAHFDRLEICNLTPDSLTEEEISQGNKKQWEMSVFEGEWVRGITAGGCRNYLETFAHNPQYRITLSEIDDDDDENKCTVIIALMQKNRRSKKQMGVEFLTVGFAVYYLSDSSRAPKPLDLQYFKYNVSVARSPSFINLREVSCRFRLPPGTYCIIPSTFEPNDEGEFLLRVFSEKKNNMEYGYQSHNDDDDSDHGSDQGHDTRYNYNPPRGYNAMSNFNPGGYSNFFNSGGLSDFGGFARNFFQFQQPNYAQQGYNQQPQYTNPNYPRPQYSNPNYPQPNQPQQYSNPNYPQQNQSQQYSNPNYPQPPYQSPLPSSYVQPNQSQPPYPRQPPPSGGYGFRF